MDAASLPLWVEYVRALGTPATALVAGSLTTYFAWRQATTSRNKLKLDLFHKRLEVVSAAMRNIDLALQRSFNKANLEAYDSAMLQAGFLFDRDFEIYIRSNLVVDLGKSAGLDAAASEGAAANGGVERREDLDALAAQHKVLQGHYRILLNKVERYMRLSDL